MSVSRASAAVVAGVVVAAFLSACTPVRNGIPGAGIPGARPSVRHVVTLPVATGPDAAAPAGSAKRAELDVTSGATTITIGTAKLGGTLVRASTPAGSDARPVLSAARGVVTVASASTGQGGPVRLRIALNRATTWRLVIKGGANRTTVNFAGARLSGVAIFAGADQITLRLPRPAGLVTLRLAAGASQVRLIVPPAVAVRLGLGGGAAHVRIGPRTWTGVAAGTVLGTPGWAGAAHRYQVEATAGISSLTVTISH